MRVTERQLAFIVAGACLAWLAAIALTVLYFEGGEHTDFRMHATVQSGKTVGFNVDNDSLYFGTFPPGAWSSRNVTVVNTAPEPRAVEIRLYGDLGAWAMVSENDFIVAPGEARIVRVSVQAPESAEDGEYSGLLRLLYRIPA